MHIEMIPVRIQGDPFFKTNSYLVSSSPESTSVFIIDPGDEAERLLEIIGSRKLEAIVATHGHFDHIGAVTYLMEKTGAPFYIHADDGELLKRSLREIRTGHPAYALENESKTQTDEEDTLIIDTLLTEGMVLKLCGVELTVIHTPGHSRGSVCLYSEGEAVLFSGDTLFWGTCGRTDFADGSPQSMHDSLARLSELSLETIVLPGHNEQTTIGNEINRGLKEY